MFLIWCLVLFVHALEIPNQLDRLDQRQSVEIIGLSTTSKFLSQAYPLGGYSGFEVSLGFEMVPTNELANLGNTAPVQNNIIYPTLTIGKGIFNDSDVFVHFTPPGSGSGLTKYGATFRWSFYEALFVPLNLFVVGHAGSSNLQNKIITRNLGADLMAGLTLSSFSLFIGGGWANSAGQFTGGADGVTESLSEENAKVESSHFVLGATYNFEPFFVGLAFDQYRESVVSFKSGFLF